jgi:hypothetical protein
MAKERIFLGAGEYRAKWHKCARCGLYFINRYLALDAILKGCPGCIGTSMGSATASLVSRIELQPQGNRLSSL